MSSKGEENENLRNREFSRPRPVPHFSPLAGGLEGAVPNREPPEAADELDGGAGKNNMSMFFPPVINKTFGFCDVSFHSLGHFLFC